MKVQHVIDIGNETPRPWAEVPTHGSYEDIQGFADRVRAAKDKGSILATTVETLAYRLGQAHEELRETKAEVERLRAVMLECESELSRWSPGYMAPGLLDRVRVLVGPNDLGDAANTAPRKDDDAPE